MLCGLLLVKTYLDDVNNLFHLCITSRRMVLNALVKCTYCKSNAP